MSFRRFARTHAESARRVRAPDRRHEMTEDHLRAAVTAERGEQAELLAALRPEQWDVPTLCAGWRVREVVAHTTMPFRASLGRTLVELAKARGDINRMADQCARRDAARMPAEALLTLLRSGRTRQGRGPGAPAISCWTRRFHRHPRRVTPRGRVVTGRRGQISSRMRVRARLVSETGTASMHRRSMTAW
ncbi:maleylpyruvate isomerase family mycothiol-dependent enzyme [Sphaerisporangium sp. NPDC088356]|uniref:maleylpyruvate isomerase family mycothiol-dependent enzyme n=1 Tax=Sphaerisporangium sp. NPDC088356 TaxID=3154871 RepID=UPI0034208C51